MKMPLASLPKKKGRVKLLLLLLMYVLKVRVSSPPLPPQMMNIEFVYLVALAVCSQTRTWKAKSH